ncbi:MAG: carboxypeptidase regulatory-like domain-containing protein, partial [Longimicrobiales bacterium]|nr:carboxypeptidase regulatory-like domain-containing protein [Longimicrobiales bacterium]
MIKGFGGPERSLMSKTLSPSRLWVMAAGVLTSVALPVAACAQQVTVTGMVVERTQSSWIGGATVRLSGSPSFFTNLDGAFRFTGVTPGPHTLTVEALGYQARSMGMVIQADTALLVEMDPDPILLDSLLVRAGNITIRGEILDAETGQRVLYAQVTVEPGFSTLGAVSGQFRVPRVPVGRAVTVRVEAVEYLPVRIALITEADTSLTIELEPDPVGIRIVAEQVKKLETRFNSIPHSRSVIDREDLANYPGWTAYDIVETRLRTVRHTSNPLGMTDGGTRAQCLFIDDVRLEHLDLLYGLMAGEVERVEIFDRGGMIRVYTKRFVVGLLGKEPGP